MYDFGFVNTIKNQKDSEQFKRIETRKKLNNTKVRHH